MTDQEKLHFKIGLSSTSTIKRPKIKISLNDVEFVCEQLQGSTNKTEYFEFDTSVSEGDCLLVIELMNKSTHDTVLDSDNNIVEDLLLNIDSIEIDDVDLGSLLWTSSIYKPIYPNEYKLEMLKAGKELPDIIKNCVNLGWNGQWILPFTSPFYIWLLENI